ncbi:MAG TPA: SAF domain-containing protein [Anaerolineales bacterium]|nr:SAF domain-containing protein [Anaerolineales bacterium]
MRRGRLLLLLVLIVIVGLVVLYLVFNQLNAGPGPVATQAATSEVYYAAQSIPAGTVITEDMLATFALPPENVSEVMFEKGLEEGNLINQTARFTLDPGTLITTSMVGADPGELPGPPWAVQVPPGMVAVGIPTNRLATAAYGVTDGAHVNVNVCMTFIDIDPAYQSALPNYVSQMRDLFFPPEDRPIISIDPFTEELPQRQGRTELDPTFQKPIYVVPSEPQRPRLVCQTVLQDVIVLNLGNFALSTQPVVQDQQDPNAAPVTSQADQAPDIITLMVSPQDSISLNYFVYSGAVVSMTLRNPNDNSQIDAQSATLTSILTQYNISLPSKLPYAQQPRLDVLAPPLLPNDIITVQPQQ